MVRIATALVAVLICGPIVAAQTVYHVDGDAPPGGDGASWATAYDALPPALVAAAPGDQIWVAAGTYVGNFTLALGVGHYGGFAGTETEVSQRDWSANETILDGDQSGSVVTGPVGATEVTRIDGFTITGGDAGDGGGLYLFDSSPTIANNRIRKNRGFDDGGGLYLYDSSAVIANNTITNNHASQGGGLYLYNSSAVMANNTITNNNAAYGGGLDLYASSPTIVNTVVAFNSSGVHQWTSDGAPTLRHNCVFGNTAFDYDGVPDPTGTDGNISVDPHLANSRYGDVHLQPDSACVDAGANADAWGDFDADGDPRILPANGTVDIGADESDGTVWPAGPYTIVRVSPEGDDANDGSSWALAKRTVQAGIDAASAVGGDVWVQAGTFEECVTLKPYAHVYGGFASTETLRDERDWVANITILDGQEQGAVVIAQNVGTDTTRIDGFTITGGGGQYGGGLYLGNASPTIANNTITGNSARTGGGIYVSVGSPEIRSCTIVDNNSENYGGGLYLRDSSPTIATSTIRSNGARWDGGGIYGRYSSPRIANSTIIGNSAGRDGGGAYVTSGAPKIVNSTIANNGAGEDGGGLYFVECTPTIANAIVAFNSSGLWSYGTASLRHNCVYGNTTYDYWGVADPTGTDGNISADPRLAGPRYGNVHLQPDSPCVDAGNTADAWGDFDVDGDPRILPAGGSVDIGADESDGTSWPAGPYATIRVEPEGDDANDGSTWGTAKRTVQAGIDAASASGGEVWVEAGTYGECITLHPYAYLYGGFAGTESVRSERDWVANVTVLDGQQQGSVVTGRAGYRVSAIDGFTITGGSALSGGGLYLWGCSPTIANNTITGNSAISGGGGLRLQYASPTITRNTITDNSTLYHGGGGLELSDSSPIITSNTITRNSAGYGGGGLELWVSSPTIANNAITGNRTDGDGGGIRVYIQSAPTIVNNTIAGNRAGYFRGGGLWLQGLASTTIVNNLVAFNSSGVLPYGDMPGWRHNCVYGNDEYDYGGFGEDPTGTDGNVSIDPVFARTPDPGVDGVWGTDDDDYGDLHLSLDSPIIDAGDNVGVPADAGDLDGDGDRAEPMPFDLDGFGRFVDDPRMVDTGNPGPPGPIVDMGAYERRPGDCASDGGAAHDGDVDFADYTELAGCLTGPGSVPPDGCECLDLDGSGRVDLADVAAFQLSFTGE